MTPDNTALIQDVEARLQAALQPDALKVVDESDQHIGHRGHGGLAHLSVSITAGCFQGLPLIKRHQMVYDVLKTLMNTRIHALRMETKTPGETRT